MPLDNPVTSAEAIDDDLIFFEPLLPASETDDWQEILRQIFATEGEIWQRRTSVTAGG